MKRLRARMLTAGLAGFALAGAQCGGPDPVEVCEEFATAAADTDVRCGYEWQATYDVINDLCPNASVVDEELLSECYEFLDTIGTTLACEDYTVASVPIACADAIEYTAG